MATNLDDLTAIRTRFFALWPSATTVVLDNDPAILEPTTTWCRLSIQPGASFRASLGSTSYRQIGRVFLQIFVPAERGTAPVWALANIFESIFRNWSTADLRVRFDTPEFRLADTEDGMFAMTCSIPYSATH